MATITVKSKIIVRNDTDANWVSANPVLLKGEAGYCTDKLCLKFGDGSTKWNDLPKFGGQSVIIQSTAPSDGSQHTYEEGTFWIDLSASSPEIYILIQRESDNREWLQLITAEALAAKGAMLAKDFAKESEAGAKTGYVDKALSADKLKTARAVTLAGAITGNTTFDGSKDISIETSLKPLEEQDIPELSLSKIKDAGTAAACNTGTEAGQIPVIGEGGKLNEALIPQQTLTTDNVNEGKKNLYYTNERVTNYLQDTANTSFSWYRNHSRLIWAPNNLPELSITYTLKFFFNHQFSPAICQFGELTYQRVFRQQRLHHLRPLNKTTIPAIKIFLVTKVHGLFDVLHPIEIEMKNRVSRGCQILVYDSERRGIHIILYPQTLGYRFHESGLSHPHRPV